MGVLHLSKAQLLAYGIPLLVILMAGDYCHKSVIRQSFRNCHGQLLLI